MYIMDNPSLLNTPIKKHISQDPSAIYTSWACITLRLIIMEQLLPPVSILRISAVSQTYETPSQETTKKWLAVRPWNRFFGIILSCTVKFTATHFRNIAVALRARFTGAAVLGFKASKSFGSCLWVSSPLGCLCGCLCYSRFVFLIVLSESPPKISPVAALFWFQGRVR